jgi:hypothetical protein
MKQLLTSIITLLSEIRDLIKAQKAQPYRELSDSEKEARSNRMKGLNEQRRAEKALLESLTKLDSSIDTQIQQGASDLSKSLGGK